VVSFSTFHVLIGDVHRSQSVLERGLVDVCVEKELKIVILLSRDAQRLYEPSGEYFDALTDEMSYFEHFRGH
jgi:hypothetical protein